MMTIYLITGLALGYALGSKITKDNLKKVVTSVLKKNLELKKDIKNLEKIIKTEEK